MSGYKTFVLVITAWILTFWGTYLNMFDHFPAKTINWDLHFLISPDSISLLVVARFWLRVPLP